MIRTQKKQVKIGQFWLHADYVVDPDAEGLCPTIYAELNSWCVRVAEPRQQPTAAVSAALAILGEAGYKIYDKATVGQMVDEVLAEAMEAVGGDMGELIRSLVRGRGPAGQEAFVAHRKAVRVQAATDAATSLEGLNKALGVLIKNF
jgi:ABC-type transport system substrate-binding protein